MENTRLVGKSSPLLIPGLCPRAEFYFLQEVFGGSHQLSWSLFMMIGVSGFDSVLYRLGHRPVHLPSRDRRRLFHYRFTNSSNQSEFDWLKVAETITQFGFHPGV